MTFFFFLFLVLVLSDWLGCKRYDKPTALRQRLRFMEVGHGRKANQTNRSNKNKKHKEETEVSSVFDQPSKRHFGPHLK